MDVIVTGATRVAGVFGYPVHHSLSPAMHNAAFHNLKIDYVYVPFSVCPDNLETAVRGIRALDMVGVNLTIPHKERVIQFLDWVSDDARKIGSVNTIYNHEGLLRGYSTDGEGFIRALVSAGKSPDGSNAVVLGAGGSARAISYSLATRGSEVTIINRTHSRAVELADSLNAILGTGLLRAVVPGAQEARDVVRKADLLVNCTSVGMYPHIDEQPIPSDWLHRDLFVYDQIYNPLETMLLRAARTVGCRAANGVGMLVYQGASAFEMWTGQSPSIKIMEEAVLAGLEGYLPKCRL